MNWNPLSRKLNFAIEHAALGAAFAALTFTWLGWSFHWSVAIGAFLLMVTVKETLWDPKNEIGQPFLSSGATDLFFYVAGIAIAVLIIGAEVIHWQ